MTLLSISVFALLLWLLISSFCFAFSVPMFLSACTSASALASTFCFWLFFGFRSVSAFCFDPPSAFNFYSFAINCVFSAWVSILSTFLLLEFQLLHSLLQLLFLIGALIFGFHFVPPLRSLLQIPRQLRSSFLFCFDSASVSHFCFLFSTSTFFFSFHPSAKASAFILRIQLFQRSNSSLSLYICFCAGFCFLFLFYFSFSSASAFGFDPYFCFVLAKRALACPCGAMQDTPGKSSCTWTTRSASSLCFLSPAFQSLGLRQLALLLQKPGQVIDRNQRG
eukprot:g7163.t1